MLSFSRVVLSITVLVTVCLSRIFAADAVVVDPATGALNAANVTVNRTTPATGGEVVRGDDPRLGGGGPLVADHEFFSHCNF